LEIVLEQQVNVITDFAGSKFFDSFISVEKENGQQLSYKQTNQPLRLVCSLVSILC